eukprot:SAG31_NODE_37364_length_305_cov_0.296117_1_plen_22_part_01
MFALQHRGVLPTMTVDELRNVH